MARKRRDFSKEFKIHSSQASRNRLLKVSGLAVLDRPTPHSPSPARTAPVTF